MQPLSTHAPMPLPDPDALHASLTLFNRVKLTPVADDPHWQQRLNEEHAWRLAEGTFVEAERSLVRVRAASAPTEARAFVRWFEQLKDAGPGQHDPLFPWLAQKATREQLCWFLTQEVAGEAGFDDLVALTQVKLPPRVKLEMARNFWDEMGQGKAGGMHGPMLGRLAESLALPKDAPVVWESLALGNLMSALASSRRYAYHSVGALGVIELTAPGRAALVNEALKRLGIDGEALRYFALHSTLDVKHSLAWNAEVLRPLVEQDPRIAPALAEGALMRLRAGARCFERYRRHLWAT